MRITCALVLLAALAAGGCGAAAPEPLPFKPFADNKLLMQAVLDPAADGLWDSVGWIITTEGTEEIYPRTDEEWDKVKHAVVTIIESGNLLMMVPRAKDGEDWMRFSQGLIDVGTTVLRAVESKDRDKVFTMGGDVYDVCTACHAKYSPEVAGIRP